MMAEKRCKICGGLPEKSCLCEPDPARRVAWRLAYLQKKAQEPIPPEEAALGKTDPWQAICLYCGGVYWPGAQDRGLCHLCE